MHIADKPVWVLGNTQVSLYVLAHGLCLHGLGHLCRIFIVSANKNKDKTAVFLRNKQQLCYQHLSAQSFIKACKVLEQNTSLGEHGNSSCLVKNFLNKTPSSNITKAPGIKYTHIFYLFFSSLSKANFHY